jgi:hypothetical protein
VCWGVWAWDMLTSLLRFRAAGVGSAESMIWS